MNVTEFAAKFIYGDQIPFIHGWRRIDQEPYTGVCQDYALTVLLLVEGSWPKALWALITFRAVFWLVKSPVNGFVPRHIMLYHRDHGWNDSTAKEWRATPGENRLRLPLLFPWVMFRAAWGALNPFK